MARGVVTRSVLVMGALAAWAQVRTEPYAQILVNQTVLRKPDISMLTISTRNPTTGEQLVIASNNPTLIGRTSNNDREVLARGQPVTTLDIASDQCQTLVPLRDVSGNNIGALKTDFRSGTSKSSLNCLRQAEQLRDELGDVIPSAKALFDPFMVSSSPQDVLAQRLTIETLAKYPDVLVLAFHVTAPGENINRVVGINEPKFVGRPSDEVDQEVATTGKTIVQVIPSTHRMETHMPLRAADGSRVGTLVTVYLWQSESETPGLIGRSMEIRDELGKRIPSLGALVAGAP